jgi:hypothetical protein
VVGVLLGDSISENITEDGLEGTEEDESVLMVLVGEPSGVKTVGLKFNYICFIEHDQSYFINDEEDTRDDEVKIYHGWVREIDSDGDTEHFVFPVNGRKREVAEKACKKCMTRFIPSWNCKGKGMHGATSQEQRP